MFAFFVCFFFFPQNDFSMVTVFSIRKITVPCSPLPHLAREVQINRVITTIQPSNGNEGHNGSACTQDA